MEDKKEKKSEFSYREDIQMTAEKALYDNCLSSDLLHIVTAGAKYPILTLSFLATGQMLNNQAYSSDKENGTAQIEYVEEVKSIPQNQIIEGSNYSGVSPYALLQERAKLFSTLPSTVREYGLDVPDEVVAENAARFIGALESIGVICPKEEDVLPSSFGTIVIDIHNSRGVVSMEIGHSKIGFFTDYKDGINEESDGMVSDFKTIPIALKKHLIENV